MANAEDAQSYANRGYTLALLGRKRRPGNDCLLVAAQGFLELGLPLDANEEIEQIHPDVRHVPELLAVRVEICRAPEKWELSQEIGENRDLPAEQPERVKQLQSSWAAWRKNVVGDKPAPDVKPNAVNGSP